MKYAAKALFCSGLLLVLGSSVARGGSMGSLAPHEPSDQQKQQLLTDPATGCRVLDSDFDTNDSIRWQGNCADGYAWGRGQLTFLANGHVLETLTGTFSWGALQPGHVSAVWADGSKYDGNQLGGQFDGQGVFVSATADKLDGSWKAGALNGHANVVWANGDRYDGEWKGGKSDGHGTEIWADGRRYEGLWKEGKPAGSDGPTAAGVTAASVTAPASAPTAAPTSAAVPAAAPAAALVPASVPAVTQVTPAPSTGGASHDAIDANEAAAATPLGSLLGAKLVAVDGSTVEISPSEDGVIRTVTLPNGVTQQVAFSFMTERLGTVSSESSPVGLFRTTPREIDVDFADGTVEAMKPGTDGGLVVSARAPDGVSSCTIWYSAGHSFGDADKKAAVLEYAARLGVSIPAEPKKRHSAPAPATCGGGFLEKFPSSEATTASENISHGQDANSGVSNPQDSRSAMRETARGGNDPQAMLSVPVKASDVHLVDNPAGNVPQASLQTATFSVSAPAADGPAKAPESAVPTPPEPSNASQCLSVESNGQYWGFQNGCTKTIQFSYCEMSASNPLTLCGHASVSGSVSANGFSALVSDRTLAEQGVQHEFRWMACDGGAGEVVPHLDSADPPQGRCQRAVAASGP